MQNLESFVTNATKAGNQTGPIRTKRNGLPY
nr:MAG TPA: hypothetical protein [Caudoviricetes sp.]